MKDKKTSIKEQINDEFIKKFKMLLPIHSKDIDISEGSVAYMIIATTMEILKEL